MLSSQSELYNVIGKTPPQFLPTILEYVKMINKKDMRGELSDTEYLNSIPGIAESIIKEAKRDLDEYSDELDW
jgi:hypothetical protein